MRPAELLAAGYALAFLAAGLCLAGRRPRAWQTVGCALAGLAVAVTAPLAHIVGDAGLRAWWLLAFVPLAYWMPAPLVDRANERLEAWLLSADRRLGLVRVLRAPALELSYLLVYPTLPLGLGAALTAGGLTADQFWLGVVCAALPCYGLLPILTTRPPRVLLEPSAAAETPRLVRQLNLRFLAVFSHQWNTLPSGHAAVAAASAVLVWKAGSPLAPVMAVLAAGIALGTISGRYHYVVDTVLGVLLGVLAGWIAAS
jgi:hypothetical protein